MDKRDIVETAGHAWKNFWGKVLGLLVIGLVLGTIGLAVFRVAFVDFVDNYEIAYKYDRLTGKIEKLGRTGYIVNPPFIVNVHSIDGRPMQVCISSIQRVLNCKLVQFNPEGLETFVSWHGRNDYSGSSSQGGSSYFNQILMAYAYEGSGKNYPFLTVIRELKSEETVATATPAEPPR